MIVDAHAHVLPGGYPPGSPPTFPHTEMIDGSTDRLHHFGGGTFRAKDVFFEVDRRLEAMEVTGVDLEVVSPMPALLRYDLPAADGLTLARYVNEWVAELCRQAPDRFIGLGIVPLQSPELATAELADIKARGLAGVEVSSGILGASIGDPRFLSFFQEVERLELAVFVHAMPSDTDRLPAAARATYTVGVEGMYAAASLILGGIASACPDLRISFSHAAGGFPFLLPRANFFWGGTWNEEPADPERAFAWTAGPSPIEVARRFYYDSLVFDRRALRFLVDLLGADRLLLGSDFPAMHRETRVGATAASLGLSTESWEDLSWRNAMRWVGRDLT